MTEEIRNYIVTLDGHQLESLRRAIEEQERAVYDRKENFYLHKEVDGYIYITHFADGSFYYDCIGQNAYERYRSDPMAVSLERKTKDLFPVYEQLLSKGEQA